MHGEAAVGHNPFPPGGLAAGHACTLPCAGCDAAVASARGHGGGHDLERSPSDGCWVVRIGFAEKLRSDDACLACSYFRNKTELLSG